MKIVFLLFLILTLSVILFAKEMVFFTQDFAPFSYSENSEVKGPAVDIINKVCGELSIEAKFGIFPWKRAIESAKKGDANALFVLGWNKPRTEWLYFSHPIIKTEYGVFVHKDNAMDYSKPSDLNGYTVSVYGPSNTSRNLEKIAEESTLKIDMTPDDVAAFRKVDHKRVSGAFSNKDVGWALINDLDLKNIRYAGAYKNLNYYIGFLKDYNKKEDVDLFNAKLKELTDSGEIQKILDKYNMQGVKE